MMLKLIALATAQLLFNFSHQAHATDDRALLDKVAKLQKRSSITYDKDNKSECYLKLANSKCIGDKNKLDIQIKDPVSGKMLNFRESIELNQYFGGDREGNGGDLSAIKFKSLAANIIKRIRNPYNEIMLRQLADTLTSVVINTVPVITYQGLQLSALNLPSHSPQRIILSREVWSNLDQNSYYQDILILHELLPLIGINDESYSLSMSLLGSEICYLSPNIKSQIMRKYQNKTCNQIAANSIQNLEVLTLTGQDLLSKNGPTALSSLKKVSLLILDTASDYHSRTKILMKLINFLNKSKVKVSVLQLKDIPCVNCELFFADGGARVGKILNPRKEGQYSSTLQGGLNRVTDAFYHEEKEFLRLLLKYGCETARQFYHNVFLKKELVPNSFQPYQEKLLHLGQVLLQDGKCPITITI
jgi:hypothetical protein